MSLVSWIRSHFRCGATTVERADTAIDMADEVATKARSLQKQLEPFSRTNDPFHAVFTKNAIAIAHERRVEFDETPRAKP